MMTRGALYFVLATVLGMQTAGAAEAPAPEAQNQTVRVTQAALDTLLQQPGAQIRYATEAEAQASAHANGVELPPAPPAKPADAPLADPVAPAWGRPWVIVKAGIGVPGNVNADIEVYVGRTVTVEVGAGTGLVAHVFMGSVKWRPDATCWGCSGRNLFSIGFGLTGIAATRDLKNFEALIAAEADAHYIHRFVEHFGFVLGLKTGVGPSIWNLNGQPRVDLGLILVGYLGLVF